MVRLEELATSARSCVRCPLHRGRTQVVFGEGPAGATLMVVGEAPGEAEDRLGRPFVGRSGQLLDRLLAEEAGLDRSEVYIANVVKCRPPANRDPLPAEVAACRPYLDSQVELVGPRVLLTLGNFATRALLRTTAPIGSLRGRYHQYGPGPGPASGPVLVLVPTFHPAFALRNRTETLPAMRADFVRAKRALADPASALAAASAGVSSRPSAGASSRPSAGAR
ncbi:MAG: uracil-DNA glycosylase [Acidimicrobiales bacterium]